MTIRELIDNINALGIGVGSDAEDVLERDLATDVRLPALINRGVADLFRVRPARGVVTIDLKAAGIVQSDGTVDVYNALSEDARHRFERLDAYSIASEDMRAFGITANAWTSDRLIRVNKYAVEHTDDANITLTYRMKPATITVNDIAIAETKTFDDILDEGLCDLLPLFVASKLYLEEDPGKANQFRSEYEARRNEILAREYNHPEASRFVLTNGW